MFRHLRAGQSLRHGVDGVGGRKRASKLSWSLAEALRESDAKFVIDRAHCLWIARDARQGRLLFRLRAIGFHNQHLTVRAGVLGQTNSFGTGAANIVPAANHVHGGSSPQVLTSPTTAALARAQRSATVTCPPHHPPRATCCVNVHSTLILVNSPALVHT